MSNLWRAIVSAAVLLPCVAAAGSSNPGLSSGGTTERIVPKYPERGVGGYAGTQDAGGQVGTGTNTGTSESGSGTVDLGNGDPSSALSAMMGTTYGETAAQTANQLGVNVEAVAAFGQAESGWRNIPTANGTSSATGPWQITGSTFTGTSARYGLGYTTADISNPQAQAVVSSYIIRDTANAISAATGQSATIGQTYAGYVFGPTYGARIATATSDTALSRIVPSNFLTNNALPLSTTVGQLNANYANRLSGTASQTALTGS